MFADQFLQENGILSFYPSPYEVAQEEIQGWCELHSLTMRCPFDVDVEAGGQRVTREAIMETDVLELWGSREYTKEPRSCEFREVPS